MPTHEQSESGIFSPPCDCPPNRTERSTFGLFPSDTLTDDWLRRERRKYARVPAVHHTWTDKDGNRWMITHLILDQTE